MHIFLKFNLILILFFGSGVTIISHYIKTLTAENALQSVTHEAQLLLDQFIALRKYTVGEISPLLRDNAPGSEFHAQTVPAYAATQVANIFKLDRPEYNYKEAVFNPTNPRDNAAPWEEKIINKFIANESLDRLVGKRIIKRTKVLYIAQPIKISDPRCLVCHSVPEAAPASMVEQYGKTRGYGWKLNETVGIQMMTVPFTLTEESTNKTVNKLTTMLTAVFIGLFVLFNILFYFFWKREES